MHLNFQTPSKWTCCSNADFKELYDDGLANCLAECTDTPTTPTPGTTTTKEPGPSTTKGPTPDCQNIPDSSFGAVRSPGYPGDLPNGMDESCWTIGCPGGWTGILNVESEVAYKIDFMCSNDFESGESSSEECEDKWSQKKCEKCNAKKCRKSKSCKKNCQNTCKLCDDRILAPTTTPSPTLAANCTIVDGPSDAIILTSPGYPYGSVSNVYPQCWTVKCGSGNRMLHVKSNLIFELDYLCNDSSEECEDKWAQKKCKKKCNAKKCKKSKSCKKNCENTCKLCDDRILAPFY